jgi:hypothetical protein
VGQPAGEDPSPMRSRPGFGPGAGVLFAQFWERIKSDIPTWLFGTSIFFIVICLFFPILDADKTTRREVKRDAATREQARRMRDMANRLKDEKISESEKDRIGKDMKEAQRRWDENEKPKLDDEVDEAKESARSWHYWYHWGMMWGFLLLAFACLGSLTPEKPPVRRVVACIVLCALLLLVLTRFVGRVNISGGIG